MSAFTYHLHDSHGSDTSFDITFSSCTRETKNWKEELYEAARTIAQNAKRPLWLCMSGTIESEVMCHAFFDQGIHVSILSLVHTNGTNEHDIRFARAWCKTHGLNHNTIPIDVAAFLERDIPTYAENGYVSPRIFPYVQIKLLETVEAMGGYAVLGSGEQYYHAITPNPQSEDDLSLRFDIGHAAAAEWCRQNNTTHEPFFFYSTPELCLSYLQFPVVDMMLKNPWMLRHSTASHNLKQLLFHSHWPTLASRHKHNGWERVLPQVQAAKQRLADTFGTVEIIDYRVSQLRRDLSLHSEKSGR